MESVDSEHICQSILCYRVSSFGLESLAASSVKQMYEKKEKRIYMDYVRLVYDEARAN